MFFIRNCGWSFVWFSKAMSACLLYASKPWALKWQQPQQRHRGLHPLPPTGQMPRQSEFINLNSHCSFYRLSLVRTHVMKHPAQKLFFLLASVRKQLQNIGYTLDLRHLFKLWFLKTGGLFTYAKKHGYPSNQTSSWSARYVRRNVRYTWFFQPK